MCSNLREDPLGSFPRLREDSWKTLGRLLEDDLEDEVEEERVSLDDQQVSGLGIFQTCWFGREFGQSTHT